MRRRLSLWLRPQAELELLVAKTGRSSQRWATRLTAHHPSMRHQIAHMLLTQRSWQHCERLRQGNNGG